jgi:hypothetical protein
MITDIGNNTHECPYIERIARLEERVDNLTATLKLITNLGIGGLITSLITLLGVIFNMITK